MSTKFYATLNSYIETLLTEFGQIPDDRQAQLKELAHYIQSCLEQNKAVQLNFICTHNSRRSHISQIWAYAAAYYFGLENVHCFSGGTEATAFNPRAVAAMKRAGFHIEKSTIGRNPQYQVYCCDNISPIEAFSKTYDDPSNPQSDFAAVMTCNHADTNCPFIPGAKRFALTYEDPKVADDTGEETDRYDERVRQIGRELFFMMSLFVVEVEDEIVEAVAAS
ncbi:MAG: protein-tyrosine-phosphatase [Bacteroidota bacterium]